MKTYSIGRDLNCDIVINDSTDVISRRHALLNVTPSGEMTLIDQSSNGTYVNGIRISPNVSVPVTRKDIISFAHVAKLDWNQVPKSNQWVKYVIGGIIIVVVILAIIFGMKAIKVGSTDNSGQQTMIEVPDSTQLKQNVEPQDSLKKAAEKATPDSIKSKKPSKPKKPSPPKTKDDDKPKDKKGENENDKDKSQKTKRTIG